MNFISENDLTFKFFVKIYVCVCVSLKGLLSITGPFSMFSKMVFQPFQAKTLNLTIIVKNAYDVLILFVAFLGYLRGWENG